MVYLKMGEILLYFLSFACFLYALVSTSVQWKFLSKDLFHIGFAYRLVVVLTLVFPTIETVEREQWDVAVGVIILVAALSVLVAVDVAGVVIKLKKARQEYFDDPFASHFFLVIFFLGWVWRIYALSAGLLYGTFLATQLEVNEFGNAFGLLNGLSLLGLFGYLTFLVKNKKNRISYFLVTLEILWALISGSKIAILYVLIPVLLILVKRGWVSLSGRFLLKAALFGFVAIQFSFIGVTAYRVGVQKAVASGQDLSAAAMFDGFLEVAIGTSSRDPQESEMRERVNWASYLGALVAREDLWRQPWFGESFIPIVTWWIPRTFWPDKPNVSIGAWYGESVLGWDYGTRSEGAITIWGDGLINFGVIGVFFVSFFWVFFSFLVYKKLDQMGSWGLLGLASIYVKLLLGLEQNFANPVVAIQQQLMIVFIFYAITIAAKTIFGKR